MSELKSYKKLMLKKEKRLNPTTIINNTTTNNIVNTTNNTTYTAKFNQLLSDIIPFTPENINEKLGTIDHQKLLNAYVSCEELLRAQMADKLKYLAFCVDQSRRIVVTKDEQGAGVKQNALDVINTYINVGSTIILEKLNQAHEYMHDMYNNDQIPDENIDFVDNGFKTAKNMFTTSSTKSFNKKLVHNMINNCENLNKGIKSNTLEK